MSLLSILAGDDDALLGRNSMRHLAHRARHRARAVERRAQAYLPHPSQVPLFGSEVFQMSGLGTDELLGRSFMKRMVKKAEKAVTHPVTTVKKVVTKAPILAVAPVVLAAKTVGTTKGRRMLAHAAGNVAAVGLAPATGGLSLLGKKSVRKFVQRHPVATAVVSPLSLAYTGSTKKGRTNLTNAAGNAAAFGLVGMTGGLSLLGKKKIRAFAGRQVKGIAHVTADVGRGIGHFTATTAREVVNPSSQSDSSPDETQDSGGPSAAAPKKKSSFVLPLSIGAALLSLF